MVHKKYNNKKTDGGKRTRSKGPSASTPSAGLSQVNAMARRSGMSKQVVRKGVRPTDFGGVIIPFSEGGQIPAPFIPKEDVFRIRQGISSFNSSSGISGGGTHPFFTSQAATDTFPVVAFELDDLAQEATLANLFDQYRFDMVEMIIKPSNSALDLHSAASPNQINPQVVIVLDFDDSTALTSAGQAEQYDNHVVIMGSEGAHIKLVPAITPAVWTGGAFTGYAVSGPQWLDCNSNTVPHFGIKFAVQGLSTASTEFYQWNLQTYYHMSFRNVR